MRWVLAAAALLTACAHTTGGYEPIGEPKVEVRGQRAVRVGAEVEPVITGGALGATSSDTCAFAGNAVLVQREGALSSEKLLGPQLVTAGLGGGALITLVTGIAWADSISRYPIGADKSGASLGAGALVTVGVGLLAATAVMLFTGRPFVAQQSLDERRVDLPDRHWVWLPRPRSPCRPDADVTSVPVPPGPVIYRYTPTGSEGRYTWESTDLQGSIARAKLIAAWCGAGTLRLQFSGGPPDDTYGDPDHPTLRQYFGQSGAISIPGGNGGSLAAIKERDATAGEAAMSCCIARRAPSLRNECSLTCAQAGDATGCSSALRGCLKEADSDSDRAEDGHRICERLFDGCLEARLTSRAQLETCVDLCSNLRAQRACQ